MVADNAGKYCMTGLVFGESTLVLVDRRGIWRGRRGICRHLSMFRWHLGRSILVLRWAAFSGALRRAWAVAGYGAHLYVAGVALGDIYFVFKWQPWHLAWQV